MAVWHDRPKGPHRRADGRSCPPEGGLAGSGFTIDEGEPMNVPNDQDAMEKGSTASTTRAERDRAQLGRLTGAAPTVIIVAFGLSVLVGLVAIGHGGAMLMAMGAAMVSFSVVFAVVGIVIVLHVRVRNQSS